MSRIQKNNSGGKMNIELRAKNKRRYWIPALTLIAILLIVGPIVAPLFPAKFYNKLPASQNDTQNQKQQFGLEEVLSSVPRIPAPMVQTGKFALTGILSSPQGSYCIINNQVMRLGEEIQGAKLIDISKEKVLLEIKGDRVWLSIS